MITLYRLALHLYPKAFRAGYGDAMVQHLLDERRAGRRVALHVVLDLARTAPRMRLEIVMARRHPVLLIVASALGALVLIARLGPIGLVAIAVLLGVSVSRQHRGKAPLVRTDRWPIWLGAGVAVLAAAITGAVVNGEFDSEVVWTGWMIIVGAGVCLAITGVVLGGLRFQESHQAS
jgi:hypothetical protein